MSYFVYILYSPSTDSFYKGQTSDINDRLRRHNNKQEQPTKNGAPWTLLWVTEKNNRGEALILEKKLKNLSRDRIIEFIKKYKDGVASPDVS
ncbi:MAG: GIY-YIG nuclease family protein [Draconibacterium sp.]